MTNINITIERNPFQVTNCPQNFTVVEADGFDLGAVVGNGSTEEKAMQDFIENYMLRHDKLVTLTIHEKS